jgi:hypothetical protein
MLQTPGPWKKDKSDKLFHIMGLYFNCKSLTWLIMIFFSFSAI